MKNSLKIIILLIFTTNMAFAQKSIGDSAIVAHLIYGTYSYEIPGQDMAGRFGGFSQVGPGYLLKTRSNWILGVESSFGFGSTIKNEDEILKGITTSDGNVIDMSGVYADFQFNMRSFSAMGRVGKVIPVLGPNKNSGIMLTAGLGYLQHKIYIEHKDKSAPQITGEYVKGYDELKRGFVTNVFLGYLYLGNSNKVNFFAGLDFNLGFMKSGRPYSFTEMKFNTGSFTDTYGGVKVGWIFPVYKRAPKEFYYY
ncbi:MAG: hypothetical protein RBS07_01865 [Lentimicrobium sp.]|nr:hypothetical protein [Lentimicrobium sp.]